MKKKDLVTTTLFENFLPVRLSCAAWQSLLLANSINTLPQPASWHWQGIHVESGLPGTSTPGTGLGISTDFTSPNLPHSSLISSRMSSYSSCKNQIKSSKLALSNSFDHQWWDGITPHPWALLRRPCWGDREPQLADQDLPCLPFQAPIEGFQ